MTEERFSFEKVARSLEMLYEGTGLELEYAGNSSAPL